MTTNTESVTFLTSINKGFLKLVEAEAPEVNEALRDVLETEIYTAPEDIFPQLLSLTEIKYLVLGYQINRKLEVSLTEKFKGKLGKPDYVIRGNTTADLEGVYSTSLFIGPATGLAMVSEVASIRWDENAVTRKPTTLEETEWEGADAYGRALRTLAQEVKYVDNWADRDVFHQTKEAAEALSVFIKANFTETLLKTHRIDLQPYVTESRDAVRGLWVAMYNPQGDLIQHGRVSMEIS